MKWLSRQPMARRQLIVMLLASALLLPPLIGQLKAIADLSGAGHISTLAFMLQTAGIFFIPTSAILTITLLTVVRKTWRQHLPLIAIGAVNLVVISNLAWFLAGNCSWAHIFGIALSNCQG